MTIAKAIGATRTSVEKSWPPCGGYRIDAGDVHDRKLIWYATLDGIDRAARVLARTLRAQSSRFDEAKFLALAHVRKA